MAKLSTALSSFIRDVFGRDREARRELTVSSRELATGDGSHHVSAIGFDSLSQQYGQIGEALGLDRRLLHRYTDYEQMDEYGDISCLGGDSLIFTLKWGWIKIKDLVDKREPFYILSYDKESRSLVPGYCTAVKKTGEKGHGKQMVSVYLDNGVEIKCTEDHLFMTKDEKWVEAGSLGPGDRLMPGLIRWKRKIGLSQPHRIDIPVEKVEAALNEGGTIAAAAKILSVSWSTVKRYAAKYDLCVSGGNHRVFKVERIEERSEVYDLTVPRFRNFVCNGIVVHNSALDIYADDSTQVDSERRKSLWVECQNNDIKTDLEDMFYKRLDIEGNDWEISRQTCKYGNDYEEIIVGDQGVVGLNFLPPATMRRVEGMGRNLLGFVQSYSQNIRIDPADFEKLRLQQGGSLSDRKDVAVYEDWRVVHFRLRAKHRDSVYGWAVTDSARWAWKRLLLLEDAVMIYKLCLRGDSQVWTPGGRKAIKDLEKGDEVYSYTVDDKLKKTRVVYKKYNGKDRLYRIQSSHRELYANETHPVLVETIIHNGKGNPLGRSLDYVEVQDLVPGIHRLVTPYKEDRLCEEIPLIFPEVGKKARLSKKAIEDGIKIEKGIKYLQDTCGMQANLIKDFFRGEYEVVAHTAQRVLCENGTPLGYLDIRDDWGGVKRLSLPEKVTPDFARWFGFMIGDGYVSERPFTKNGKTYLVREVGFSAGDKEEINQQYRRLFESFFGETKFDQDKRSVHECVGKYNISSKALYEFMLLNGFVSGAHNKRIPEWVFRSPTRIRQAFLDGLVDADGLVGEGGVSELRNRVRHTRSSIELCNKELVEDVRELVIQLGYKVGSVTIRKREGGREILDNGYPLPERVSYAVGWSEDRQKMTEILRTVEEVEVDDIWDIGVEADEHNFVANGVVVHNTRSPSRYAFYVDVGNLGPKEAERALQEVKNRIKKKKFVNPKTGKLDFRYNPLSWDEDFFLGTREGREGTRVDVLNGPSYQQVEDVQYFLYKLYAALKVPRAYLGYDENQPSKATLSSEDVRFARTVIRVQKELRNGFHKVARVHLAARRIDPASVDFEIAMTVPSSIFELGQQEVRRARAEIAQSMERHVSLYYLLSNVYAMSDDEIQAVMKQKEEEMKKAQTMGGGAGGMGGGFESVGVNMVPRNIITEKELMDGNREHEKRIEDFIREEMRKQDSKLGRQLRETRGLIQDIADSITLKRR